jgi:hypothetical protein
MTSAGREIRFVCFADIRSVARTFVAKWLTYDLQRLPKLPSVYKRRVEVLQRIADDSDLYDDEPRRREVRMVLRENVEEMRESIENRRFWLKFYRAFEREGIQLEFSAAELEAELDAEELESLRLDLEPVE